MKLSRLAVIDSLLNIIPHLQWERIPAQRLTPLAEGVADAALNALEGLAHHAYLFLAYAALDAVDKPLVLDDGKICFVCELFFWIFCIVIIIIIVTVKNLLIRFIN